MANLFDAIGAASNRVLGTVGKVAGAATTKAWGSEGPTAGWLIGQPGQSLSDLSQYKGSTAMTPEQRVREQVSQGKPVSGQDTQIARDLGLNFTYDPNAGIQGDKSAYNLQEQQSALGKSPSSQFTAPELAALGLGTNLSSGQEVTVNGQKFKVIDNGNGTRSFEAITSDGDTTVSGGDKVSAIQNAGDDILQNLKQSDIDAILQKQYNNMNELAGEIERIARENAEREYNTILDALGRQRGEVSTLSTEQKENITRQSELTEAELKDRSETEQKDIEKQRAGFVEGVEETKDNLARQWKDLSLQVQRIMRGRGISDSTFASGEELKVLREFNQGLRQLALKKSSALQDFADAIIETNKFYTRKQVELKEEVRVNLQKVDQWVRGRVLDIQNQEGMALSNKLNEINNANLRAETLRTNIKNEILQKQLDYDLWLKQTEINYKLAVATAAKGKVASAGDQIKEAATLSRNMATLLQNGQARFTALGDGSYGIQDLLTGSVVPTTDEFITSYKENQDLQKQILEQRASGSGGGILGNIFGNVGTTATQDEEEQGGLFSSIQNALQ